MASAQGQRSVNFADLFSNFTTKTPDLVLSQQVAMNSPTSPKQYDTASSPTSASLHGRAAEARMSVLRDEIGMFVSPL